MDSMNSWCTKESFGDDHFSEMSFHDDTTDNFDMTELGKEENVPSSTQRNLDQTTVFPENKSASVRPENTKSKGALEPTAISHEETVDVHRFKFIVLLVLLWVVLIASPWVFAFTTKTEQSQFEQKFQSDASKILEAVRMSIDNTLMPMDSLALALVSHAKAQNDTWPFVTIPDYGARVAKMLPMADSIWISVLPVVAPADRLQWEDYARGHDSWVEESFSIQNKWPRYHGPKNISFDREMSEQISGNFGPLETNIR